VDFAVRAVIGAVNRFSAVFARMGVDVGRFGSQAERSFGRAERAGSLFKTILGANLATLAIRRLGQEIRQIPQVLEEFASRGMEIGRTAGLLGLTAEAFQRLSYAAKLTDTPTEALTGSMKILNRNLAQLRVGTGTLHSLMAKVNPALARQLRTVQDSQSAFLLVSDAVVGTKDAQLRAAIATAAFGRRGQELIPMLAQGRTRLHELMKEASVYGTVLDDKAIAACARMEETMKRLRGAVRSVKDQVLGLVVQGIAPYLEKALAWVVANKEIIATKITDFISRAGRVLRDLQPVFGLLLKAVGWLLGNKDRLIGLWIAWTAAQIALNMAMGANPVGIAVLALEALIGVALLVITHWREITAWTTRVWEAIRGFGEGLWNSTIPYLKAFGGAIMTFLLAPLNLAVDAVRGMLWVLSKLPGKAGEGFRGALDAVTAFQDKANSLLTGSARQFGFGELGKGLGERAPNEGMRRPEVNVTVPVNVDNTRAPGVSSMVRRAPPVLGYAGINP